MRKGWEYKKLGEVATFINGDRGKNYPSAKDFVESGVPFINAGHLNNGIISYDKMNYITINKYNSLGSGKIIKNDILFCLRGSLGKYAIVAEDSMGAIASSLVIIRPFQNADNRFIAHFLSSAKIKEYIAKNNNGSSQPNLSAKSVASFIIPLPTLSTQLAIVSELDKINELIRLKKEQLKDFDNLAQSLFYEMFGDSVENEKGWEVKKLGDCFSYIKNGANIKQTKDVDGFPITRIETLAGGIFNRDRMGYAGIYDLSKYSAYVLESRDLLMSHINSKTYIGRTVEYKRNNDETIIHGMNLLRLKAIHDIIDSTFFVYYTKSGDFKSKIARIRKDAVNQSSFAISDLKRLNIPLPPLSLQRLFAQRIEQIEREKSEVQKSIQDLETLLASRMQYWFE